jgi:hypothetical protein
MDRELLLVLLAGALVGPAILLGAAATSSRTDGPDAPTRERERWRILWRPLLAGAFLLAGLGGWAWNEPEQAEAAPWPLVAVALPFLGIWLRAGWRALRALRRAERDAAPAATHGLLRPRIRLSPEFARRLDPGERAAVRAHEEAHRRRRDPLRIWLAQLATDLQWPSRNAARRFAVWLQALEIACDDEARRAGARGEDLAAALVTAARLLRARPAGGGGLPAAALATESACLERRVRRLLDPLPPDAGSEVPSTRFWWGRASLTLLVGAGVLGLFHGEAAVRLLLRITA